MSVPPALLQRLARSRLRPLWAAARTGFGERPTRDRGSGLEFADFRAYQPGDDLRHLDPHLHARLGENFIRQYEVHRQLDVTILIDSSRSMRCGGVRLAFALDLASVLAFVALAGGDTVRLGLCRDGGVEWSRRFTGASRAGAVQRWLDRESVGEGGSFRGCLRAAARQMRAGGLTLVLSDWWDAPNDLEALAAIRQEVWAVHLLLREEIDPSTLGDAAVRMIDAETGEEVSITLDDQIIDRFRQSMAAWRQALSIACEGLRGRYLPVPVDPGLEELFLRDWRREGVLT